MKDSNESKPDDDLTDDELRKLQKAAAQGDSNAQRQMEEIGAQRKLDKRDNGRYQANQSVFDS